MKSFFALSLLASCIAAPLSNDARASIHNVPADTSTSAYLHPERSYGCGEVDVIFTGLPPYHPLVTAQGFDPAVVDRALRGDAANILKAGYNLRVVLMGPEQNVTVLANQMNGVSWEGTGVGYGVRGGRSEELTIRLEDIISLFRIRAPFAPIVFDRSPDSALEAIKRHFSISKDCTSKPGKDLGFKVFCDICSQ